MITKKTLSRLNTIQALYLFEINAQQMSIEQIIEQMDDLTISQDTLNSSSNSYNYKSSKNFFLKLLNFTISNINFIDNIVKRHLNETWSIEKLDICLLVVLRVAIGELYLQITPLKVVINEYILIGREFVKDKDIGFINSLLDNVGNQIKKNELL